MNKEAVAQELVKIARSLSAIGPRVLFTVNDEEVLVLVETRVDRALPGAAVVDLINKTQSFVKKTVLELEKMDIRWRGLPDYVEVRGVGQSEISIFSAKWHGRHNYESPMWAENEFYALGYDDLRD